MRQKTERPGQQPLSHSQTHLNGCTLESRLDVLGNHIDVGLSLGWWVRQVCVLCLQGTTSKKKKRPQWEEGQGSEVRMNRQAESNSIH